MLTKEINPPMPNLGPPNISSPLLASSLPQKPPGLLPPSATPGLIAPQVNAAYYFLFKYCQPFYLQVTEPGLPQTPKAVVKPQVLTHVIDGHVIKESSAPFPVSPAKGEFTFRFRFTVLFVTKNKNLFEVFSSRCI